MDFAEYFAPGSEYFDFVIRISLKFFGGLQRHGEEPVALVATHQNEYAASRLSQPPLLCVWWALALSPTTPSNFNTIAKEKHIISEHSSKYQLNPYYQQNKKYICLMLGVLTKKLDT